MDTRRYLGLTVLVCALIASGVASVSALACTGFMMSDGERVLVGNNEDYNIPYTRVWFVPAEEGDYGRVYFGYDNWSPQGGMNDQGLFFDFFATKPLAVQLSKEKPKFPGPMIDRMSATCATVGDVLDMFSRYNLASMSKFQMFIVDKTGDAAIVEGDDVIRKRGSYQVVTNFYQSKVPENQRPCQWHHLSCMQYKRAEMMLAETNTASVPLFRRILDATHRKIMVARTLYSNIYDLNNRRIYLYYLHNFDDEVIIDLDAELAKGAHYYELPTLFGKDPLYGRKTYTHASPVFRISYPKHYQVVPPIKNEVLRIKSPMSGTPLMAVYIKEKPEDVALEDIGEAYLLEEMKKLGTNVRLVSGRKTALNDGTPANEVYFDWVANRKLPLKTIILSTFRGGKLVLAVATSFAHPESLREYLHTLTFPDN